ncbi:MAG: BrnT family toxin [Terracidiphilus sp.]
MYEWDEAKREANLRKHDLDFDDADSVLENPGRITFVESGRAEKRWRDLAFVEAVGSILAVVYTIRGYNVRIISFRKASRKERREYDNFREQKQN